MNQESDKHSGDTPEKIELPTPTALPIVFAFGLTLLVGGLVTTASISILGAVLAAAGAVGWFRQVLPMEFREWVPVVRQEIAIRTTRETVERVPEISPAPRAWLPVQVYPISAGIKGGLAGGAVMALLAGAYGIFSGNGIWYPMNLLVAGFFPEMETQTATQIGTFHLNEFLVAIALHLVISLAVGLLYGAMLPMLPKHPILLGGFVVPLVWSGMIHSILEFVNPVMNHVIDWPWFVISQIGFGIAAGLVVTVHERILTHENLPLIARMGIEAPGLSREHQEDLRR
jgi:hypothetical protein